MEEVTLINMLLLMKEVKQLLDWYCEDFGIDYNLGEKMCGVVKILAHGLFWS